MIKVQDDYEDVKAEMKEKHMVVSRWISGLKAQHKPKDKCKPYPSEIQARIDRLAFFQNLYSVSKNLPVRIDGIVINYKLYTAFVKKLKGFRVSVVALPDGVVVNYWKPGTLNHGKGVLKLYDISPYFQGFSHIPNAELIDDGSES